MSCSGVLATTAPLQSSLLKESRICESPMANMSVPLVRASRAEGHILRRLTFEDTSAQFITYTMIV